MLLDFEVLALNLKASKVVMKEKQELEHAVEQSENQIDKVKCKYLEIQENIKKLNKEIEKSTEEEAKMKNCKSVNYFFLLYTLGVYTLEKKLQ